MGFFEEFKKKRAAKRAAVRDENEQKCMPKEAADYTYGTILRLFCKRRLTHDEIVYDPVCKLTEEPYKTTVNHALKYLNDIMATAPKRATIPYEYGEICWHYLNKNYSYVDIDPYLDDYGIRHTHIWMFHYRDTYYSKETNSYRGNVFILRHEVREDHGIHHKLSFYEKVDSNVVADFSAAEDYNLMFGGLKYKNCDPRMWEHAYFMTYYK